MPLPWYERNGLMSFINPLKNKIFKEDPQGHVQSTTVVNFAMIHAQARGEKVDDKPHNTVCKKDLRGYKNKDEIVSSAIHVNRIEKQLFLKHFIGNFNFFLG